MFLRVLDVGQCDREEVGMRGRKANLLLALFAVLFVIGVALCRAMNGNVLFCSITFISAMLFLLMLGFFHDPFHQFPCSSRNLIVTPTSNAVITVRRIVRGRVLRGGYLRVSVFVSVFGMRTG